MPECSGNNQLGKPGEPLEPFMATFHDGEGEPIIGMPIKFVIVKGGGKLEVADDRTNFCGGVCAELVPDATSKRGRVELRYGANFEQMIPFLYSLEGVEEEANPLPAPPPPEVVTKTAPPPKAPAATAPVTVVHMPKPLPKAARHPSGVNVQALVAALAAPQAQAPAATVTKTVAARPANPQRIVTERTVRRPAAPKPQSRRSKRIAQRLLESSIPKSHAIKALMICMFLAMTIPVYAFVNGVRPLFLDHTAAVTIQLIADCTRSGPPRIVDHQLVYDNCPLFRK